MNLRRLVEPPRPWHVVLAPVIPFGSILLDSLHVQRPDGMIWPTLVASGVAVVAWLILAYVLPNHRTAALLVTIAASGILGYRGVELFALSAGVPGGRFLVDLAFVFCVLVVIKAPAHAPFLTKCANQGLLAVLVLLALMIAKAEWARPRFVVPALGVAPAPATAEHPDVYVILLDAYGRADILREHYAFDNPLVSELRSLGFTVADASVSNYPQTALSMASALNLEYLQTLVPQVSQELYSRRGLGDLLDSNRTFALFDAAGYEIVAYASSYSMMRPGPATTRPAPFGYIASFGFGAYEATSIPVWSELLGVSRGWLPLYLHRRHLLWTLDDLAARGSQTSTRPRFVFAHLLAPHPPFAFAADGTARRTRVPALGGDGDHWQTTARRTGETYEEGYVDTIRVLNRHVLRIVANILEASRPAVILIHSDHGPGGSKLNWEHPDNDGLRGRHGILLAARFPEGTVSSLGHDITLVNAYRAVLAHALDLRLPPLEDRAYFATWSRPFSFVDVTQVVRRDRENPRQRHGRDGPQPDEHP